MENRRQLVLDDGRSSLVFHQLGEDILGDTVPVLFLQSF
jgi:hypothetical protein